MSQLKQVIVIRRDLWLRTGSQVRCGIQAGIRAILDKAEMEVTADWLDGGAKLETYIVSSEEHLLRLISIAEQFDQPVCVVDAQNPVKGNLPAALAIGPGQGDIIDRVVAGLSAY